MTPMRISGSWALANRGPTLKAASAEAVKLEKEEASQKELTRVKKATDDLEIERQKNAQTFRP